MPTARVKSKWSDGILVFTDTSGNEIARFDPDNLLFRRAALLESLTAATTITQAEHDEKTLVLNKAAGLTVTLPAATGSGTRLRFVVGTTPTSNAYVIQVADATDVMDGMVITADDGSPPGPLAWVTAAGTDTVTLNGTTQGGLVGDEIELEDIATNQWAVRGFTKSSGSEATPFSAAVS